MRLSLDKGFESTRRLVQYRDAAAADEMIKIRRRAGDRLRYDEQLATIQPGAPDLPDGESKANEWNRHHLSAALKLNQAFVALNNRATCRCSTITPLGLPVEPEV